MQLHPSAPTSKPSCLLRYDQRLSGQTWRCVGGRDSRASDPAVLSGTEETRNRERPSVCVKRHLALPTPGRGGQECGATVHPPGPPPVSPRVCEHPEAGAQGSRSGPRQAPWRLTVEQRRPSDSHEAAASLKVLGIVPGSST